eukprot:Seg230.23 transcript_id=Seg230.23/GoldUCD/mRNA.D3Y31 product="Disks large-associated protein 2" protein_id=Seg230.23/GoldUCD/D3Y31
MEKPEVQIDISRLSINDKENTHPDKIIKKDGQFFLDVLKDQIERFTALCEKAEKDIAQNALSDETSGKIRAAIGKAQLLITKKFKQFEKLCIENMETPSGKKRPMSTDLEGFWDMVAIQVEDVSNMFEKIDELRKNNWKEVIVTENDRPDGRSPSPRAKSGHKKRTKNNNYVDEDKARKDARQRLNEHLRAVKSQKNLDSEEVPIDISIRASKSFSLI